MGNITSGRQLFGSMTWQMLFRDGYEALAMLDDNRDGELTGEELADICVWFDSNGDSISDPGEVKELGAVGIVAINVRGKKDSAGNLGNPQGVLWRDGRRTPSFDWVPTSLPLEAAPQLRPIILNAFASLLPMSSACRWSNR
jgi:hypothetical protein